MTFRPPSVAGVVAAAMLLALGRLAYAQEPPAEIARGVYSYPQIAAKLSAERRRVICMAALRNRAAVASLKARPWASARAILAEGLGVRFRDAGDAWVMELDPAIQQREAAWRSRFAEQLRSEIAKKIAAEPASRLPLTTVMQQAINAKLALKEREKTDPEHEKPETKRLAERVEQLDSQCDPGNWLASRSLRQVTARSILAAFERPQPLTTIDVASILDVPLMLRLASQLGELEEADERERADQQQKMEDVFRRGDMEIALRMRFGIDDLKLYTDVFSRMGGEATFSHEDGIGPESPDAEKLLEQLGGEAAEWMKAMRAASKAFLATDRAKQPFPVNQELRTDSLSQAIESWSRTLDGDVVMELAPYREYVDLPDRARTDNETHAVTPAAVSARLASLTGENWSWSYVERDGVLLVMNGLAFLDHVREVPLPALLRLERSYVGGRLSNGAMVTSTTFADLIGFHQATTAELSSNLYDATLYRAAMVSDYADARPLIRLLADLPADEAQKLYRFIESRSIEKAPPYVIPLASLPPAAIQRLADELRMVASGPNLHADIVGAGCFRTGFAGVLRTWSLALECQRMRGGAPGYWTNWTLKPPGGEGEEGVYQQYLSFMRLR